MNIKQVNRTLTNFIIVAALTFAVADYARADSTNDIVNALIAKGVLTEEEGELINKGRNGEVAAQKKKEEKQAAGAEVYIVTTDTHFSHKVWHETSPAVSKAQFPLVGDPTHTLTRAFDVHIDEEGLALRGTFIINPDGIVKTAEVHSNEIARDVGETLRKLKAAQYTAANPGQVCPAKWKEGAATIAPSLDLVGKI